jgi:hypothetical protein
MAVLDASDSSAIEDQEPANRDVNFRRLELEPTPLELAHLLAELNFLRAQLTVLRSEADPPSGDAAEEDEAYAPSIAENW